MNDAKNTFDANRKNLLSLNIFPKYRAAKYADANIKKIIAIFKFENKLKITDGIIIHKKLFFSLIAA